MIAVMSLLRHISGCLKNQLHLLSVIPKSIANKADVSSEFCWGKDGDRQLFLNLIKSECDNSRYDPFILIMSLYIYYLIIIHYYCYSHTWELKLSRQGSYKLNVEGVKYSLRVYFRRKKKQIQDNPIQDNPIQTSAV
jgi:hypothetical protein